MILYPSCPLCKNMLFEEILTVKPDQVNKTLTWVKCQNCDHVFTKSYWDNELEVIYSVNRDEQEVGGKTDKQREHGIRVCNIMAQKVRFGVWVDVGTGNGNLLTSAVEYGYPAYGLDVRDLPIKQLRALGYQVYTADAVEWDYSEVDIVSLGDVLEHLPYPKEFLRKLFKSGVKGVYISCPNMDTVTWKILDHNEQNPYWKEYEHYHNFTRRSLESLLREVGFIPFYYDTHSHYLSNMEVYAYRAD